MAGGTDLDFSLLPDELHTLGPLIGRYGESDDAERAALVADASPEDLGL